MLLKGKKFGIVSHILPPYQSGQANVLYQLLADMNPDNYCLITLENKKLFSRGKKGVGKLPGKYYYMKNIRLPYRLSFLKMPFFPVTNLILRIRGIVDVIKKERLDGLIACSGDLYNIPAAYIACRKMNIPFSIYMFDDYVNQWTGLNRVFSRIAFSGIKNEIKGIIAPNEYLSEDYKRDFGADCTVIHNPSRIYGLDEIENYENPFDGDAVNIVYTGSIYGAHYDAFKNIADAIELIKDYKIFLHLYTSTSKEELEKQGISGERLIFHDYINQSEIPKVLRKADILFLPLAFKSDYPEVIRTSAPGKMGEYLSVGRPILVHAPEDSFISSYFREHECGVVMDKDEALLLSVAITKLASDNDLKDKIGSRARKIAEDEFSLETVRKKFEDFIVNMMK